MFVYQFNEIAKVLFILSIIFLAISILIPNILLPLNKAWMKVGFILGTIISPLIIGLIFFVIFTPISFLFKIIRRDELRLKKTTNQSTHWRIKKHQDDNQSSLKKSILINHGFYQRIISVSQG